MACIVRPDVAQTDMDRKVASLPFDPCRFEQRRTQIPGRNGQLKVPVHSDTCGGGCDSDCAEIDGDHDDRGRCLGVDLDLDFVSLYLGCCVPGRGHLATSNVNQTY